MREKGVHDMFHVALLTKAPEDKIPGRIPEKPMPIEIDKEEEWELEDILDSRMMQRGPKERRGLQYLVKWKGLSAAENTWEPVSNITHAQESVDEFHQKHPEAPRKLKAAIFAQLPWQHLENFTLYEKKEHVKAILHSRDLVP